MGRQDNLSSRPEGIEGAVAARSILAASRCPRTA